MRIDFARPMLALGLLAFLSTSTGVHAAPPPKAREAYRKASKAYEMGRFNEALAGYEEAYRRDPRPETLFNMAQCQRQLGDPAKAAFLYRRYLVQSPTRPRNAALAEELIAEMDRAVEAKRAEAAKSDTPAIPQGSPPLVPQGAMASDSHSPPPLVESSVEPQNDSVLRKWWFWTAVGVVAAGAAATTYVLTAPSPSATTLGTRDLR